MLHIFTYMEHIKFEAAFFVYRYSISKLSNMTSNLLVLNKYSEKCIPFAY